MSKSARAAILFTIPLTKNLTIPVPRHPGDVPKGTLRSIIREMQMSVEEFNAL